MPAAGEEQLECSYTCLEGGGTSSACWKAASNYSCGPCADSVPQRLRSHAQPMTWGHLFTKGLCQSISCSTDLNNPNLKPSTTRMFSGLLVWSRMTRGRWGGRGPCLPAAVLGRHRVVSGSSPDSTPASSAHVRSGPRGGQNSPFLGAGKLATQPVLPGPLFILGLTQELREAATLGHVIGSLLCTGLCGLNSDPRSISG